MFISHKYKVIFVHIQRTGGNSIQKLFDEFDPNLVNAIPIGAKNSKHCFISEMKAVIDEDIFRNYTKFSVIRNPYDRMVSWYSMFKSGLKNDDATLAKVSQTSKYIDRYFQVLNFLSKFFKRERVLKYGVSLIKVFKRDFNSSERNLIQFLTIGTNVMVEINKHARNFEEFVMLPRNHKNGLFERFYINQFDYISEQETLLVDKVLKFENLEADFNHFAKKIGFEGQLSHINQSTRKKDFRSYYNERTAKLIFQRFKKDFDYFGYEF